RPLTRARRRRPAVSFRPERDRSEDSSRTRHDVAAILPSLTHTTTSMAPQPRPLLIGGEWIADTGEVLSSVNPATGRINHEVCAASARHVDAAVESARSAV